MSDTNHEFEHSERYDQFVVNVEHELDIHAGLVAVLDVARQAAFINDVEARLNVSAGLAAVLGAEASQSGEMPSELMKGGDDVVTLHHAEDGGRLGPQLPPEEPGRSDANSYAVAGADAAMVELVRRGGPDSVEYRYLREALIEAALGVLSSMDPSRILRELRLRGLYVPTPPPTSFAQELPGLRYEAVRAAIDTFMDRQIMAGGWEPNGKASLSTFFTDNVIYRFATDYRRYYREESLHERSNSPVSDSDELEADINTLSSERAVDPEATVVDRATIRELLPTVSPELVEIVLLAAQGYTQREIARMMNMTEAKVSSALRRYRKRSGK